MTDPHRVSGEPYPTRNARMEGNRGHRELLLVTTLFILGLVLRLVGIGSQSLWIDEAQSMDWAVKSVSTIVYEAAHYNQAPLYFLLLKAWVAMRSDSETWARLLSALLGTALIPVLYWYGREQQIPRSTLVLSSLLLTLSPLALWHSQDARMYTLMLLGSYSALAMLFRFLRTGSGACLWGFGIAMISSLYTHAYMVFLIPVAGLFLLLRRADCPQERLRKIVVALLGIVIAYLPWAWVILNASRHEAGFYRPISFLTLPYTFFVFSVGYSLGPSVGELHQRGAVYPLIMRHLPAIAAVGLLFGLAAVSGMVALWRCSRAMRQMMVLLLSLPILLPVLVTLGTRVTYNVRYAIVAFPAFVLLAGLGLDALRPRSLRLAVTGGVLTLIGLSLHGYHSDPRYAKDDTRSAFHWIETKRRPGDCVVVQGVTEAYRYYERPRIQSRWFDRRGEDPATAVERSLAQWSSECRRYWLVSGREWEADPQGLVSRTLADQLEQGVSTRFPGVQVTEFRARKHVSGTGHPPPL